MRWSAHMAFAGAALFLITGCGGGTPAGPTAPSPTPPPVRPNVILIVMDDLDFDLMERAMPRMQALIARPGLLFENFFISLPLCCPSRATILRGQYVHNHGIQQNGGENGGFGTFRARGLEGSTIATWLQDAGYRTVLLGKYLNNYPEGEDAYVPPGWSEWYGLLEDRPAGFYNYFLNENHIVSFFGESPAEYEADVLSARTLAFLARSEQQDDQPFFIYLNPAAPHAPAIPAPRHEGMFRGVGGPRKPSHNEPDVSDKPRWLRRQPPLTQREIDDIDSLYADRMASLQAVDEMIERIVQTLDSTGELGHTYLLVTSDNGVHHGEHRFPGGKNSAYEEATRVGLVVRGPGVPAGRRLTHLVGNVDLAPTIAAIAGVAIPPFVDGKSMVPLLGAAPPAPETWRDAFLLEKWPTGAPFPVPAFFGVRTLTHKLVDYYGESEVEFYDLVRDPYEERSQSRLADPATYDRLKARTTALSTCVAASCR
jgi:N-acetylglucosamine-6-sulfatase